MVLLNKRQRLFTAEDDARIIDLKENQQMTWAQIATFFQGRSRGTLQVHYSRALKGRNEPGLSGTAIECKLEAVEDINSLRSTSPPSRLCLQRAAKVKRLQILAPDIGHGVLSKSNTNDVAAKTFTEALPVPAGSATEDRRHVRSTALAEPEHLPKRSSKRKSQAIQAPTSKSRSTRRVSNRMATEEMSRVTGSIGAAAVKTTDPELEGATTSRDNMMTTRRES